MQVLLWPFPSVSAHLPREQAAGLGEGSSPPAPISGAGPHRIHPVQGQCGGTTMDSRWGPICQMGCVVQALGSLLLRLHCSILGKKKLLLNVLLLRVGQSQNE